jgi:haloalkane dehalogenase
MRIPATIIWGASDDVFDPNTFIPKWQELWPHAEGPHLVVGRHFLHEDSGHEIGTILADFIGRTISDERQR